MENNFFNYITKQLNKEEVDIWLRTNNIIPEKMELYYDFCNSLYLKITETYLGDSENGETKIEMTEEDKKNHFNWCWKKTLEDFQKEEIIFEKDGEHYTYFKIFFEEIFYKQDDKKIRNSIDVFFRDVFDFEKTFTRSDLDMILEIYKNLDKNINI
jgi:hypothetical protein